MINVIKVISFRLVEENVEVSARNTRDKRAILTAELVWEAFNLKNTGMRTLTSAMRLQELNKEMNKLYKYLQRLKKDPTSKSVQRMLEAMLRKESRFAAFKREYIRENKEQFPQLEILL